MIDSTPGRPLDATANRGHTGAGRFRGLRAALATLALVAVCWSSAAAAAAPPNIVIFIADDISAEDVGCYGNEGIHTPEIDALAAAGIRFDAAFLTASSCSPSRASIMSGRYPHATGAEELHMPLPAEHVMFAQQLREAGYHTVAAGKWHLGEEHPDAFDERVGGGPSGAENWLRMVRERPPDQPFFFWFAAIDAHLPWDDDGDKPHYHTTEDVWVPPYLPDNEATRDDLRGYYDEVGRFDHNVGLVMRELERQGVADDTFVLVMADNGRPLPRSKTTVYDSGMRTPFVVHWPAGAPAGVVSRSLVSSVDIAPTMLELAGLEPHDGHQGVSFAPLLADPDATIRDEVFMEHNWHDYRAYKRAVRDGDFLYVRNWAPEEMGTPPADAVRTRTFQTMVEMFREGELEGILADCFVRPRPEEELYDVRNDPHQLVNLAVNPEYAPQLADYRERMERLRQLTPDRVPDELTPDTFDRWTGQATGNIRQWRAERQRAQDDNEEEDEDDAGRP